MSVILCPWFASVGAFHLAILNAAVSYMPVRKGRSTCDSGLQLCIRSYQVMVYGSAHSDPDFSARLPNWQLEAHRLDSRCFEDPLYAAIFVTAVNTSCAHLGFPIQSHVLMMTYPNHGVLGLPPRVSDRVHGSICRADRLGRRGSRERLHQPPHSLVPARYTLALGAEGVAVPLHRLCNPGCPRAGWGEEESQVVDPGALVVPGH